MHLTHVKSSRFVSLSLSGIQSTTVTSGLQTVLAVFSCPAGERTTSFQVGCRLPSARPIKQARVLLDFVGVGAGDVPSKFWEVCTSPFFATQHNVQQVGIQASQVYSSSSRFSLVPPKAHHFCFTWPQAAIRTAIKQVEFCTLWTGRRLAGPTTAVRSARWFLADSTK